MQLVDRPALACRAGRRRSATIQRLPSASASQLKRLSPGTNARSNARSRQSAERAGARGSQPAPARRTGALVERREGFGQRHDDVGGRMPRAQLRQQRREHQRVAEQQVMRDQDAPRRRAPRGGRASPTRGRAPARRPRRAPAKRCLRSSCRRGHRRRGGTPLPCGRASRRGRTSSSARSRAAAASRRASAGSPSRRSMPAASATAFCLATTIAGVIGDRDLADRAGVGGHAGQRDQHRLHQRLRHAFVRVRGQREHVERGQPRRDVVLVAGEAHALAQRRARRPALAAPRAAARRRR